MTRHSTTRFAIIMLDEDGSPGGQEGFARITIGDFEEVVSVSAFGANGSLADLPDRWHRSLLRLVDGADYAILPVGHGQIWVLYRVGTEVVVQNQLLVPGWDGELDSAGTPIRPPPRRPVADGREASEWRTSIAAIGEFLQR